MVLKKLCPGWVQDIWKDAPIPDRDRILLTPFQQWRKYGQFPLLVVLHFLIVIFVSAQVRLTCIFHIL